MWRFIVTLGTLGYVQKRAWNSGFHTGMGKRHGNRMTGQVETVCRCEILKVILLPSSFRC